jgi:peptidoglycan DL-endopeptidase CwlO
VVGGRPRRPRRVDRLRREVEALAARLADQAARQEHLKDRLAAQRRFHKRLTRQVRRAVAEERRRQEQLRRRALLRRLAAERAARARAAAAARAGGWAGGSGRAGAPSGAAAGAVTFARRQLGKPYVRGASGPSSYDCSGLFMAAYRGAGGCRG